MWMRMVEVNMQFITGPGNGYEVGADDIPQSNIPLVTLVPFFCHRPDTAKGSIVDRKIDIESDLVRVNVKKNSRPSIW
jgi:hypothetical protein